MLRARRTMVGWVVFAAVVLGACSGDDDAREDGEDPATAAVAEPAEVPAAPSEGCGASTVAAGDEKVTMQSGGTERYYLRAVPSAHDGEEPVPVVVDLHGYSEGAEVHKANSKLGELGEQEGFVTLTPHGLGAVPLWDTTAGSADVTFLGKVLDEVEAALCVDTNRIYVTGFSNGAMMTSVLACAYADRIAAVAPVAGASNIEDCAAERPVPAVAFHGTDDPIVDFDDGGFGEAVSNLPAPDGGELGDLDAEQAAEMDDISAILDLPVPETMAAWGERNGCADTAPSESAPADDVTLVSFDCPAGAEVELFRIEGGGHTWPGSDFLQAVELVGASTFSISANEEMWAFFEAHPLRS